MDKQKKNSLFRKRYIIPAVIVILLIIGRILLPHFLKNSVNRTLDNIPGYTGHVEDIDVALWRGAYVINGLILKKETSETDTPMLDFEKTDISIDWKSLLKGKIVSEIDLHSPKFNYIFKNQQQQDSAADPKTEDWTKALTDLVPIDINRLTVTNGKAGLVELSANPKISLFLEKIELRATNLSNVINEEKALPSHVQATAVSFGDGNVTIHGDLNLLQEIPDMDMEFNLEKARITALNDLARRYAGVDFEEGIFELYSEVAIADGYLKGYLKPMLINTKIISEEEEGGFLEEMWEGFVGVLKFILKNQGTDTLATRAPLEGNLNDVDTGILPTVLNIFKNAWIEAYKGSVDENIEFEDALEEQ
ncbi:DUF748 domain-containing protein [Salegentibacter sp. F188]|uniref:DUF748 domain-containing protein n=1 Tax=Autumnicola patrickiae TaxID=3075591 RepID=A0ABU3DX55_9FLAO|nr:DUF748 domain-containing protein [Salegentibacter sp. F188]MDT0688309.1 DUF748 domain-containing protein [Salegentibacter sp. F188]